MRLILLAIFVALPGLCQNEQTCPWMNAATAGGVLGGTVTSTVTRSSKNKDDATCFFARSSYDLEVSVQTMTAPAKDFANLISACGSSAMPLKAIGNEAVTCRFDRKDGGAGEQVIGRVRDRAFVIRISANDRSATADSLREKARTVAEQVAGNLF